MQEKSEKEEGTVLEELQTGFMFKDNVIRPTKVKVSKR
jgi:molecular chaperone GrpE (heat shock protein)